MARNWREHERGDRVKWFIVFTAVLALAVIVTAVITKGFTDWNPYGWFDKAEETPSEPTDSTIIGNITENGVKLSVQKLSAEEYAANNISPLAESAYTLTATVTPEDATNKAVDWSVSFVNAESEWATGKTVTDYVTVTPTADGALTANVECLEAFGAQIQVTVTSRDNAEATASCTVDYAKRMTDLTVTLTGGGSLAGQPEVVVNSASSTGTIRSSFTLDTFGYSSSTAPTYSVGTVDDEFTTAMQLKFHPQFLSAFTSLGGTGSMLTQLGAAVLPVTEGFPTGVTLWQQLLHNLWSSVLTKNSFIRAAQNATNSSMPVFALNVTAEGTYSAAEFTYSLRLLSSDLTVLVESVSLDETELVF